MDDELADYFNDDGDFEKTELDKTLDSLSHVINCLLRLSVAIRSRAPHDEFISRVGEDLNENFAHWDAGHVQEKFPLVERGLANRLGRAISRRRQFFKYRDEHQSRLAEGLDDMSLGDQATTVASSIPEHLKDASNDLISLDLSFETRSDASRTTYATAGPDSTKLRVPPMPRDYIEGPFLCPFCHMIVSIETRDDWKYVLCTSRAESTQFDVFIIENTFIEIYNHMYVSVWIAQHQTVCIYDVETGQSICSENIGFLGTVLLNASKILIQ